MKKITSILFVAALLLSNWAIGNNVEIPRNITSVTVYSVGAEIEHLSKTKILPGQHTLILKDVSPHAIGSSVQIGNKEITVINATVVKKLSNSEITKLQDELDAIEKQIVALDQSLTQVNSGYNVNSLHELLYYYNTKVIELKDRYREIEGKLKEDSLNANSPQLEILVSSVESFSGELSIKYIVGSAAWVPNYDIYINEIGEDMNLKYMAKIMNSTGEDWNDVQLNLSLNSPFDKTGTIPEVKPEYIGGSSYDYYDNDDYNEQQENDFAELDQLKIEGIEYEEYDAPASTDLLEITGTKSIPSNGGIYSYEVFDKQLKTDYAWYVFPDYDPTPYLIGQVTNWKDLQIVDGDAGVYYRGNNIGDSYISIDGLPDTLIIPIGQNNEVVVEKNIIGNETFTKLTNNKVKETYAYQYVIKSNRTDPINVVIFDQIPVSQSNKAKVELIMKEGAIHEASSGMLTYFINDLTSNDNIEYKQVYTLEYDRNSSSNFTGYSYGKERNMTKKVRAKF